MTRMERIAKCSRVCGITASSEATARSAASIPFAANVDLVAKIVSSCAYGPNMTFCASGGPRAPCIFLSIAIPVRPR